MVELSTPLTSLPSFLSTIAITRDDREETIRGLTAAERKSPPRYDAAKQLFHSVLSKWSFEEAYREAGRVADPTARKCALAIMSTSKKFLLAAEKSSITPLPTMHLDLQQGLSLEVGPLFVRELQTPRLMMIHMWERSFSPWQIGALGALLKKALLIHRPDLLSAPLDFISISAPELASGRRFRILDWRAMNPLSDEELHRFLRKLYSAWDEYQRRGPREVKSRRQADMLEGL